MNQTRRDAGWRKRRIIYNNDGDDVIQARTPQETAQGLAECESGELIDDFLDARARTLLGTQVDSSWYCSCMAGKDKLFGIDDFRGGNSFERFRELELQPGETAKAHFQVGEDLSSRTGPFRLRLHLWELTASDEIAVRFNEVSLNDLRPKKTLDAAPPAHWLECEVRPDRVVHGENRLEVSLNKRADATGAPIALDCALLYVHAV